MFEKVAAAVKADREVALALFNKGQFNRDGLTPGDDLYLFCFRLTDGKLLASLSIAAVAAMTSGIGKDANGKAFGKELYDATTRSDGVTTEINYLFPKFGTTAPALPKTSIAMRVAPDLG